MSSKRTSPFRLLITALVCAGVLYGGLGMIALKFIGEPVVTVVPAEVHTSQASRAVADAADQNVFVPSFIGGEPLALGARLSHKSVSADSHQTMHLALTVVAAQTQQKTRPPLNVAVIIDHSGSMQGEKIAVARESAKSLVRTLQNGDIVSVVVYDDSVDTLIPPTRLTNDARPRIERAIAQIYPEGGTYISGGLERGAALVESAKTEESINRVVLLSDGRATEGLTSVNEFATLSSDMLERQIGVTTVGMGLDYDEDVMQTIASAAAGRYYFVAHVGETSAVFQKELDSLQGSVATRTQLEIELPTNVRFVSADGYYPAVSGNHVSFDLGTIPAAGRTDILVELAVSPQSARSVDITSTINYDDIAAERRIARAARSSASVGSNAIVNAEVAQRVQQIRTAKAFDDAMRMFDGGDRHAAAALLDRQRKQNEQFLDDNDLDIPAFDRVSDELEELAESLRKTERHTSYGKFISKSGKFRSSNIVQNQVVF